MLTRIYKNAEVEVVVKVGVAVIVPVLVAVGVVVIVIVPIVVGVVVITGREAKQV